MPVEEADISISPTEKILVMIASRIEKSIAQDKNRLETLMADASDCQYVINTSESELKDIKRVLLILRLERETQCQSK